MKLMPRRFNDLMTVNSDVLKISHQQQFMLEIVVNKGSTTTVCLRLP